MYDGAIQTAWSLWEHTQDAEFLEEIFYLSEKSKNLLMLLTVQEAEARRFSFIPDSLLEQERQLRSDLAFYDHKLISLEHADSADSTEQNQAQQRHFELLQTYRQLIRRFEVDYPDYHRLKYQNTPPTIRQLREQVLTEEAGLLEYFVGDSSLFVMLLTTDSLRIAKVDHGGKIGEEVLEMYDHLSRYFLQGKPSEQLFKESAEAYGKRAYSLYQVLFPNIGIPYPKRLIIIPDGILGYVPMSALLTQEVEQPTEFRNHAYLLHTHQLSYGYSAALLLKMTRPQQSEAEGLLAFAPDFFGAVSPGSEGRGNATAARLARLSALRGAGLGPLHFNRQEAASVLLSFEGDGYYGKQASRANFLNLASQYKILHIATHGKTDDVHSELSFLAFSPEVDSGEQSLLYIRDLYALDLSAELVVLSACESGIGKLYRGEGISSLASGFGYAGASSILTTLWQVNDARTAELMKSFYSRLHEGEPKDAALRSMKLEYLKQADDYYAHPFFWAGFISIGDMRSIESSNGADAMLIYAGIILLLLIAGGWSAYRLYNSYSEATD